MDASILEMWVAVEPASLRVLEQAQEVACSRTPVVTIRGENGTGKNLLAHLIHYLSQAQGPIRRVDCAGVPPELVAAQLFEPRSMRLNGTRCDGFEATRAGAIILNEVAALPLPLQARLEHALEQNDLRQGSGQELPVQARIIAITSADLERAVVRRSFREDLYYRLTMTTLLVPALRERPRDIGPLAKRFLVQLGELRGRPQMALADSTLAALSGYGYPGNVRELRDIVESAVRNALPPYILPHDLPPSFRTAAIPAWPMMSLEQLERKHIGEVLDYTRGRKTKAAAILGISRKTLLEKRKRYGFR